MNKPHKHAALIHAWADGAEIQKLCGDGWYDDSDTPEWYEDSEYRIKPRTVTKTGWVNLYRVNYGVKPGLDVFDTEAEARHKAVSRTVATVKVEWTEEVE